MLNAFLNGKKRGSGAEGESLLGSFAGAEDTLTSTVFERLAYLPDRVLSAILFEEEMWNQHLDLPLKFVNAEYWPRWKLEDVYKEPDCVFEFEDRVLIVEAKRFDFADQQSPKQLASEWLAARDKYAADSEKKLWLLAVGGLPDSRQKTVAKIRQEISEIIRIATSLPVAQQLRFGAISWFRLFKITEECCKKYSGLDTHIGRIVDDIRSGMLLHGVGVSPPTWLGELTGDTWKDDRLANAGSLSVFFKPPNWTWVEFRPISSSPQIFLREDQA